MADQSTQPGLARQALTRLLALALLAGFAAGTYLLFEPLVRRNLEMMGKETVLKQDLDALEKENARIRSDTQRLMENPVYVEKVAREELGMGKPGELVYRFKDEGRK